MNENLENNLNDSVGSENSMNGLNASKPNETVNGNVGQQNNMEQLNIGETIQTPNVNNNLNNNVNQIGNGYPGSDPISQNYNEVNYQNNIISNNNTTYTTKKKNKGLIIGLVIAIVALVVVVGGFIYFKSTYNAKGFLNKSAKSIIASIDKSFDALSVNDDLMNNIDKYDIISDANIKLTTTSTTLASLNNLEISFNEKMNLSDNFLSLDLGLKQNDESLSGTIIYNDNKLYINSKDIYDTPFYEAMDENIFENAEEYINMFKNFANISEFEDSMKNIVKYAADALQNAKLDTKISGLNATYTYEINESNFNKIIDKFIELIKQDKKIMEYLDNDTSLIESLKDSVINVKFEIKVKIISNEVESFNLTVNETKLEGTKVEKDKYKLVSEDTVIYLEHKNDTLTLSDEGNNKIVIELSKNKLGISINAEEVVLELSVESNKENSTLIANINAGEIKANCNIKVNENVKNKKSDTTGKIEITYNNENYVIDFTNKMEYGKNKITKPDMNNAKNYEELTDAEASTIMMNFYSKLGAFKFFDEISSIIGDIEEPDFPDYSDDDFNFDDLDDFGDDDFKDFTFDDIEF